MKWKTLLSLIGGETLFDSSALLSGADPPSEVHRALSRWTAAGRLVQLRRGLYVLAPPYARRPPDLIAIAGRMRRPSYVSLQSALAYHGAIPESVPITMSVTTGRPGRWETEFGGFRYRHVHLDLFWGYEQVGLREDGAGYVALPEKALLDLFHFTTGPIRAAFVRELRLEPEAMDGRRLLEFAQRAARPKLIRAAEVTVQVLEEDRQGETVL